MKKNNQPLISVVMPVYNAGEFLAEALDSILNQTYKNFEFIIVDDCSTDNSWQILQTYTREYKNIKIYKNKENLKSAKTIEKAIRVAKGDYLSRMDADDIALPERLEKQLNYLLKHKKTIAVGGQCLVIDKAGNITGQKLFPTSFKDVYKYIFQFCPLQQPTMMIAKNRLPKNFDYYGHGMTPVEDVELLFKLFTYGKVENLEDFVLMYRIHGKNVSLVNFKRSFSLTLLSRIRGVLYYDYNPDFQGIIMSILQTVVVFTLPQRVTFFLYSLVKKIRKPTISSLELNPAAAFSRTHV